MRTKLTMLGLVVLAATAIACGSGGTDTAGPGAQNNDSPAAQAAEAKEGEKTIVLEVTGAKSADVTFGLNADQSQELGAKVPWKKTLKSTEALIIPTVVAQNKGGGTIACKITVDGKVVKENKSTGEFAVVTCSAS